MNYNDTMNLISSGNFGAQFDESSVDACDNDVEIGQSANVVDYSENMVAILDSARQAYVSAKDSASYAAAHTYILWQETQKTQEAREWLAKQIEERNIEIAGYNKSREQAISNADLLIGLSAKHKLVKIDAREGASKFTKIVKYTLDFVQPKQASNVSRYVLALEWLESQFAKSDVTDAKPLVAAINSAGGFEVIVLQQRAKKSPVATIKKADALDSAQTKYDVLANAATIEEVRFNSKHQNKGYVVLIARVVDGKTQILGELPFSQEQLDHAVASIDEKNFVSSHAELAA